MIYFTTLFGINKVLFLPTYWVDELCRYVRKKVLFLNRRERKEDALPVTTFCAITENEDGANVELD